MLQPLQPELQSARYIPEVRVKSRLRPGSKYARKVPWPVRKPSVPIAPIPWPIVAPTGPDPFSGVLTGMLEKSFRVTAGARPGTGFIINCSHCQRFWISDQDDPLRIVQVVGHMVDHFIPLRDMC